MNFNEVHYFKPVVIQFNRISWVQCSHFPYICNSSTLILKLYIFEGSEVLCITRRHSPLRRLISSSCKGLRPLARAFLLPFGQKKRAFMVVYLQLLQRASAFGKVFFFPLGKKKAFITVWPLLVFSYNLRNVQKSSIQPNPEKKKTGKSKKKNCFKFFF